MKKSSITAMVLGTVSGLMFAIGMCMALIPEWGARKPGIIFGSVGLLFALITVIVWRRMEHKEIYQEKHVLYSFQALWECLLLE